MQLMILGSRCFLAFTILLALTLNSFGACGNFCEPKKTRNNGNDEENDGPLNHECPPWSQNAIRDPRYARVVAPFQIARKLHVQTHLLDIWTIALPPMSKTIGEIGLTKSGVLGTEC